jgi:hypothetical protein
MQQRNRLARCPRLMGTDLNDLAYFAEVVNHGGFAAAGRALRQSGVQVRSSLC